MNNLVALLEKRVKESSTLIALTYKDNHRWHYYRWQDVHRITRLVAAGFLSLEIEPGDKIGILSNTRVEWMLSDLACMCARAISVPIYPNLNDEDTAYIINHSECKILILENSQQWERWQKIKSQCPNVKEIILFRAESSDANWYTWNSLLQKGGAYQNENPGWYKENLNAIKSTDIFTIPYTSGTTGRPKGVVLTYEQIMSELEDVFSIMPVDERDTTLTFLPLSHILGRVETLGSLHKAYKVAFAESSDLLKRNILEIRPTFMIAVPRVFEKIHTAILVKMSQSQWVASPIQKLIDFSKSVTRIVENRKPIPLLMSLPNLAIRNLLGKKIRDTLGGRLRFAVSGGAPLRKDIAEFFFSVGIPIYEGYGLTETTAGVCFNSPLKYKMGSVGPALADVTLKIAEDGEILVQSKKIMKEYYKNPEETQKVFKDGFFCTGDIGEIDSDGFLTITDRKKDLIKTAGGKYVAPQKLTDLLKHSPYISQVHIHGDQQRYVVALITLNEESIRHYASEHQIEYKDLLELSQNTEVRKLIKEAVANANSQLASFESIKKFHILPNDFSIETGEMTPSMKLKRKFIDQKFKQELDQLHGN